MRQDRERVDQPVEGSVDSGQQLKSVLENAATETGDPTIKAGCEAIQIVTESGDNMTEEELARQGEAIVDALVAYAKVRGRDAYNDLANDLKNWGNNLLGEEKFDAAMVLKDLIRYNAEDAVETATAVGRGCAENASDIIDRGVQGNVDLAKQALTVTALLYRAVTVNQVEEGKQFVAGQGDVAEDILYKAMIVAQQEQELFTHKIVASQDEIKGFLSLNES